MTYAFSTDQTTIEQRRRERPPRVWVQTSDDPPQGHYVDVDTDETAAEYSWYPIVDTPRPDNDHRAEWLFEDGAFTKVWVFDQALADQNAEQAEAEAERAAIRDDLDGFAQRDPVTKELIGGTLFDMDVVIERGQARIEAQNTIIETARAVLQDPLALPADKAAARITRDQAQDRKADAQDRIDLARAHKRAARALRQIIKDQLG